MYQIFSNVYSSEMSQEDVLFEFMSDANNPLAVNVLNRLLAMSKTSTNELMSEEEVMTVLGVSRRTLHRLRKNQKINYFKLPQKVMYRRSDIDEYLKKVLCRF